jgi:hypothetical protein
LEKVDFHKKAETLIWTAWNRKAEVQMILGASASVEAKAIADRLKGRWLKLSFDIQWVTQSPQWGVTVIKRGRKMGYDPNLKTNRPLLPRAEVDWETRSATLFLSDLNPGVARHPETHKNFNTNFVTPAHEFGHFLQNPDEYSYSDKLKGDPQRDLDSIMNIGNKLRQRHFESVSNALREMVAGCRFDVLVK